jgi:multimeric flavodoxin WrbA
MSNSKLSPDKVIHIHNESIKLAKSVYAYEYEQKFVSFGYRKGATAEAENAAEQLAAKDAEIARLQAELKKAIEDKINFANQLGYRLGC